MKTVFGMDIDDYLWIRKYGSLEQNEALDIYECEWAMMQEYKESCLSDKLSYTASWT